MPLAAKLAGLAVAAALLFAAPAAADRNSFDCSMRSLAISFAASKNPALSAVKLQQIADALNGTPEKAPGCNVTVPPSLLAERAAIGRFGVFPLAPAVASAASTFYVDYSNGNDANSGVQTAPFKTVARALTATRAGGAGGTIVLRAGTHYLAAQLDLTAADSNTAFQAFPGEEAWLSRGTPVAGVTWNPVNASGQNASWVEQDGENAVYGGTGAWPSVVNSVEDSWQNCQAACQKNLSSGGPCTIWTWHDTTVEPQYQKQCWFRLDNQYAPSAEAGHFSGFYTPALSPNIYSADLSSLGLGSVAGLRDFSRGLAGKRQIRARYPNADPEAGFGSGLRASSWTKPTGALQPELEIRPAQPYRPYGDEFIYFQAGSGGVCSGDFAGPGKQMGFTPPVGYWCGNQSEGGGAFTWRTPTGMTADTHVLPHQPYKNPKDIVVQAWHPLHWASRMYLVGDYSFDSGAGAGTFDFQAGGFQDARGSDDAGEFYVENVMEELDAVGEWFFDDATQTLFFNYNATAGTAPPTDGSIVAIASSAVGIVNITAPMAAPATGISFKGLGFRDAAYTYLMPHGMPSAGDWGLQRHAAVILDGTEGVTIQGCVFERVDGNAIIVSGYNRGTIIDSTEFAWIGDTAIVEWGRTTGTPVDGPDGGQDGWDGTSGDQPRYTQITNNFAREFGIWEKQSSFLIEAKSSDAYIANNVQFNGPRALTNFNDGFGGNRTIVGCLMFNSCRESEYAIQTPHPNHPLTHPLTSYL